MRTAGIYCRISKDVEDLGLGVARQRKDCEALAAQRGWRVHEVYIDNDISAFSKRVRPAYQQLLDDIKNGVINAIIVWHPDRLTRKPREIEDIIDLLEDGRVEWATCTAGDIDLSTSDGRAMARIGIAFARKESEDKSRRLRSKKRELAERGLPSGGGARPFGYGDDHMTLQPDEAAEIKAAARRVLAGDSLRSIALDWHAREVRNVAGGRWTTATIRQVLLSHRIAGIRVHLGEVVGPAAWPAIITPDELARLRVILTDPSRGVGRTVARSYLLSGFVWCARCQVKMGARPSTTGRRRYVCIKERGGCGRCGIDAGQLEELITEVVLDRLSSPRLTELLNSANDDSTDDEPLMRVAQLEADLAQLIEDFHRAKTISRPHYLATQALLEADLERARDALARRHPTDVLAGVPDGEDALREAWPGFGLDRRRAILGVVLESVTVGPIGTVRNRFDPTRVLPPNGDVRWRV